MTTEDRQIWNEAKAEVVAELQANRERYREQYDAALATDPRIWEYVAENIDNPDGHNYYELLAIRRFFELLDRWQWRPKRVKRRIRFYEKLRFSGVTGRRRYKLTPVQVWHLANIFGFARPDGRRLIRTAYLFVPRKFSKTTFAAFLAISTQRRMWVQTLMIRPRNALTRYAI